MASKISTLGSGKNVHIQGDLNSAVVGEIVDQLGSAESIATASFLAVADSATSYKRLIGVFKDPVFIKRVTVVNASTAAFTNTATDIFVKTCALDDVDMEGAPSTPLQTLVDLQGFNGNNFPAQTALTGADLESADAADAVAGDNTNVVVAANSAIYAEFKNKEGATETLIVQVHYCTTDKITIEPDGLSSNVPKRNRLFHRKARSN